MKRNDARKKRTSLFVRRERNQLAQSADTTCQTICRRRDERRRQLPPGADLEVVFQANREGINAATADAGQMLIAGIADVAVELAAEICLVADAEQITKTGCRAGTRGGDNTKGSVCSLRGCFRIRSAGFQKQAWNNVREFVHVAEIAAAETCFAIISGDAVCTLLFEIAREEIAQFQS